MVSRSPQNLETDRRALPLATTPTDALFVRNHGAVPRPGESWSLAVQGPNGAVSVPLKDLRRRRSRRIRMVLECAGNGRTRMEPRVPGVAWNEDALGCVEVRGVPLAPLLQKAGIGGQHVEVLFQGADRDPAGVAYERSLPVDVALHRDTLLVWEMNGKPLDPEHGGPLRLMVPGWFGMASVKWLSSIRLLTSPFQGKQQTGSYVYRKQADGSPDQPVRRLRVKARILRPDPRQPLRAGRTAPIEGWAWAGGVPIERVDVSTDGGASWRAAHLARADGPYAWRRWTLRWRPSEPGRYLLLARATDAEGRVQPETPIWNEGGYGNNAILPHPVVVGTNSRVRLRRTPRAGRRRLATSRALAPR